MQIYPKALYPIREKRRKAVRFAKEVLTLLKNKKINAKTGCYVSFGVVDNKKLKTNAKVSLQELLKKDQKEGGISPCSVCAVGALYLGKVALENKVDVIVTSYGTIYNSSIDPETVRQTLGCFNSHLIEAAFEMDFVFGMIYKLNDKSLSENDPLFHKITKLAKEAAATYNYHPFNRDSEQRLIKICQNIIDHKGIFLPSNFRFEVAFKN